MGSALASRQLQPELLDALPAEDPRAIQSRRDLKKLHLFLRHRSAFIATLRERLVSTPSPAIVELGAGDGTFLLGIARDLAPGGLTAAVTLIERQPNSVARETVAAFAQLGWKTEVLYTDIFDWIRQDPTRSEVVLANLVLHHFDDGALRELFAALASRTNLLLACEPRRDRLALAATRLLPLIGCNEITRYDARVSVLAGFIQGDLSRLWPRTGEYELREKNLAPFSHCFLAVRKCPLPLPSSAEA